MAAQTKTQKMNPYRALCFDIVTRLRESQSEMRRSRTEQQKQYQAGRVRAFDECYTELKGLGFAEK